jgi:uncharacterized membrane protein (UPF0182 family)
MTMPMSGSAAPEFSLTSLFTPRGRSNLAAYMAVNSDPNSPGYGQIQILQLPQDTAILGPQQVQSNFESNTTASRQLSLYRQGGSKVILGNLVTVPLGGDLLSVEPVYIQASNTGNTGAYPQLERIFTYYNNETGFAPTLAESLAQVFGSAGPGVGSSGSGGNSGGGQVSAAVTADLKLAEQDYNQAEAALRSGNLLLYSQDILKMKAALDQAQQAASPSGSAKHPSTTPTPTPSPSP